MNSSQGLLRDAILGAVRKNQPASRPMPQIPHFGFNDNDDPVESFSQGVARMAGEVIAETGSDLDSFVRNRFPTAKVICSAVPECKGTIRPAELGHWSEASKIDVSIVRSPMGVAETGSVLLSDQELQVNTIAFLSHDLVVLLDPTQIVRNIHDAYQHPYFKARPYSLLMTGPSGSGDIGGVTVHPAQGVKTLTVVLMRDPKSS
jgi:L-lactate dehydrogenase complex protein LldG